MWSTLGRNARCCHCSGASFLRPGLSIGTRGFSHGFNSSVRNDARRISPQDQPSSLAPTTRRVTGRPASVSLSMYQRQYIQSVQQQGFKTLGIYPPLAKSMRKELSIVEPSTLQKEFIPSIMQGQDVLIRDTTGSGKTFGVLLSLLSKQRVLIPQRLQKHAKGKQPVFRPGITSVFIVPNQELAFQLLDWTKQLMPDLTRDPDHLDALIQVLVKSTAQEHDAQVNKLARALPHVLVATPTRLWALLQQGMLDLSLIETLVLDEVDHLIRMPGRYATQRELINRDVHPKPAELAVREIIRSARAIGRYADDDEEDQDDQEEDDDEKEHATGSAGYGSELEVMKKEIRELEQKMEARRSGKTEDALAKKRSTAKTILEKRIQVIASSATMNRAIRHWLETNKWIKEPTWVDTTKNVVLPQGIQHYCLVVGQDSIRNMKPRADPYQPDAYEEEDDDIEDDDRHLKHFEEDDDEDEDDDDEDEEEYQDWAATDKEWQDSERAWQQQQLEKAETGHQRISSNAVKTFSDDDDRMLESVVNACTLENASTACVFFCNQPSLRSISSRFKQQFDFPVQLIHDAFQQQQAKPLAEAPESATVTTSKTTNTQQPRVFVANEMNARGLDLPDVSHVVVVGLPSCPSSYLHMAGRTGRFGKKGKVVTILRDEGRIEDRARNLFKTLQVKIDPFPHVE